MLANIMMESSCCFWKHDRNQGYRYFCNGLPEILRRLMYLSTPVIGSLCSQWESWQLVAAILADTLWVTLIRLPLHSFLSRYLQSVVEFSLQCLDRFCIIDQFWADYYILSYANCLGADEVSGDKWQLVTAFHDEVHGLILCEWQSLRYDSPHSCCVRSCWN